MADIKLFSISGEVQEVKSGPVSLEKELQTLIESNMETFFGVRFLDTDLRVTIKTSEDFEKAKTLIDRAYNEN
jgi:hypothetical protein